MLSNEYLVAKIGVDTAENEPCKVSALQLLAEGQRVIVVICTDGSLRTTHHFPIRWNLFFHSFFFLGAHG